MTAPDMGHNAPPPLEAWSLHIEGLFDLANGIGTAANDEQEAALDALLDDFRKARKEVDGERATEKRPHDEAGKAVQAKWKPLLDRCDIAADAIKKALTPYRAQKLAAKQEAERKAREEAEAVRQAAQAAMQSDDLEQRFEAEAKLEQAKALDMQANKLQRGATGMRTYWQAEITNRKAALLYYLEREPDAFMAVIQSLADKDARNEATRRDIPGVIFHERKEAF